MAALKKYIPEVYKFRICEKFLGDGGAVEAMGATRLAEWVESEGYKCSREKVYRIVREGVRDKFIRLCAPLDHILAQNVASRFAFPDENVRVVNAAGPTTGLRLASVTSASK